MKGLRDEARGTITTEMNGDDRRPRGFTLAELLGGAVAVRAPGFGDVFDAFSSTSADTHGCRDRRPADASSRIMFPAGAQFLAGGESLPRHDVRAG